MRTSELAGKPKKNFRGQPESPGSCPVSYPGGEAIPLFTVAVVIDRWRGGRWKGTRGKGRVERHKG